MSYKNNKIKLTYAAEKQITRLNLHDQNEASSINHRQSSTLLVLLNLTNKIRKRTENTNVALHPGVFSGIDFHRERVCQLGIRYIQGHEATDRQGIEMIHR